MTLLSAVKNIKKSEGLLITPKVITFLEHHPDGVVWDDDAYETWRELTQKAMGNEDRSGRFGASSRGMCKRRQIFGFLGMPGGKLLPPDTQNLFNDGKWRHLRWQMMCLQAGAITHAEHPYSYPQLRVSGSMDGLNSYESFGFELKGDRNAARVMGGIPEAHDLQIHTMLLATGWDRFVYIIEDKSTQNWREIIVRRDKRLITEVRTELEELNDHIEDISLPEVLPACAAKAGPYRTCPFAHQCLHRKDAGDYWPTTPGDWDS